MYFELLLLIVIGSIGYGLIRFTEHTLDIRQPRRDPDNDSKVYL